MTTDTYSVGRVEQFGTRNPKVAEFLKNSFMLEGLGIGSGLSDVKNASAPTGGKFRSGAIEL